MKIILLLTLLTLSLTISGQTTLPREQLNEKYKTYIDHNYKPLNFHDWLIKYNFKITPDAQTISPGIYLIKAKRQFLDGFMFEIVAGGTVFYGKYQYRNYSGVNDGITFRVVKGEKVRNICYMSAGALGLTGIIFDLSAIGKLGKAGIALDENGVGVKVKF